MNGHRSQTRARRCPRRWLAALIAPLLLGAGSSAWAANPFTATYAHDREEIFWIVHLSDSHIGASAKDRNGSTEASSLCGALVR